MGNFSLTNPGLAYDGGQGTDPSTGMPIQLPPIVKYFKNAALRGHQAALDEMNSVQPGRSDISGPNGGAVTLDSETGQPVSPQIAQTQGTSATPKMVQPSFAQTTTDANGMQLPVNPAQTKLGKLVSILAAAGKGALAGWGTGNPGAGAAAAREIPFQTAEQHQQLAQQQAQLAVTRAQTSMVPTPYGPMPMGMARVIFPSYIKAGATTGAAQIGANSREAVANTAAQSRENVAGIAKRFQVVPNVGLFDTQSRELVPQTAAGIIITPEIAADHDLPKEFIGKPLSLQNLAAVQRSEMVNTVPVEGAAGPALVNRKTKQVTQLGLGNPGVAVAQARPVQVAADSNNPGNITYQPAGQAMAAGAATPRSAPTQAAVAVTKSAAAGPIGAQIGAFNTALRHADLLQSAAAALQNGDQQTLNKLRNGFKTEFGAAGPITAQTIANAYSREVTKMLSSNHLTDAEIGSAGATTDVSRMSPAQMVGVMGAYRALATSKMQVLQQQVQQGQKGKANFPATLSGAGGGGVQVTDPRGVIHTFPNQAAADNFKTLAHIQ